jgi:hypothetical protein
VLGRRLMEKDFQGWVLDVAVRFGWRSWHVPTPMRPVGGGRFVPDARGAGLPDLVLLHSDPARLIFAELKDHEGKLSDEQAEFLRLARGLRDAFEQHVAAVREVIEGELGSVLPGFWSNPLGVYVWRPGQEQIIEAILRGRVMVRA